ncbi:hypothetical protein [Wenyingzhuangia aestuarii]|uniref:hypothetical protein n=1 Tax=Wenyingzhuangia aestuarii TaxID=1647582 RepID=UPI0014399021|nr:hypothetical protein [Wenyingzhuangia aestuarii]NJB82569.1 hypothetical protein [Wenyingzhuangia aestuarii]
MTKLLFIFIFCIATAVTIMMVQNKNKSSIKNNGAETVGTVTDIMYRGKIPFCKFSYQVDGVTYSKRQFVQKHLISKIANKKFIVTYEVGNPKNVIIQFKREAN